MVILLDGKKLAEKVTHNLMGKFKGVGVLAAVQVGDNPASELYLKKKGDLAKKLGVKFDWHKLSGRSTTAQVVNLIRKLNCDQKVAGIIVQLPLPKQCNTDTVVNAVEPSKDVDGLTDVNILSGEVLPATAAGILKLLANYKISLLGKRVVLVGFTRLLNLPMSLYFSRMGNSVTVLQEGTKDFGALKQADLIISAVGKANLIKGKDIQAGAVVVDAGISVVKGKTVGDCETKTVSSKAGYLTPVPGGVGPMTVVSLLSNLLELSKK